MKRSSTEGILTNPESAASRLSLVHDVQPPAHSAEGRQSRSMSHLQVTEIKSSNTFPAAETARKGKVEDRFIETHE